MERLFGVCVALALVSLAGCVDVPAVDPAITQSDAEPVWDLDIADMKQDWILLRLHPLADGEIEMNGQLRNFESQEGVLEGGGATDAPLAACQTVRLGPAGGEFAFHWGSSTRVALAGERVRVASPGATVGQEDIGGARVPMEAGVPLLALFGHADLSTYKERGAEGSVRWEADAPFTVEVVAQGPMFCSFDVFSFEGELTRTPLMTAAERLELDLEGGAINVWLAGFGGEMDLSIETDDGIVGPAHVAGQEGQQHLHVYGVERAKLVIEDLRAGWDGSESLLVHAILGLPPEASQWIEAQDEAWRAAVGDDA